MRARSARSNRVFDVRKTLQGTGVVQRHGDEVDAPERIRQVGPCLEVVLSRSQESIDFAWQDGLLGGSQTVTMTSLHFDEDERLTLTHNEIELAAATTPVRGDEAITVALEVASRELLTGSAQALAAGLCHVSISTCWSHLATGAKHRRWWSPGPCSASRALWSSEQ